MDIKTTLCAEISDTVNSLITMREDLLQWMQDFIKDVRTQEIAVNSVKTVAATGAVVSTVTLFTPLAPAGAIGLAISGVTGAATTLGDFIANRVKDKKFTEKVDESKELETKLQELLKQLDEYCEKVVKEMKVSKDEAYILVLWALPNVAGLGNSGAGPEFVQFAELVPHLELVADTMRVSATVASATTRLTDKVITGAAAGLVVGSVGQIFGVLGAVGSVADVIYSWATDNPCLESAKQVVPKIEDSLSHLKKIKSFLDAVNNEAAEHKEQLPIENKLENKT